MSVSNGFKYPDRPKTLPALSPVEERLISPRLPFMQIRRLRHEGSYGTVSYTHLDVYKRQDLIGAERQCQSLKDTLLYQMVPIAILLAETVLLVCNYVHLV